MQKMKFLGVLIFIILMASTASAQFLGQMTSANCLDTGSSIIGGYLVIAENTLAVVGSASYGFSEYLEGRARMGIIDYEGSDVNIILGGDIKYQLWEHQQESSPFDMSLGAGMEYSEFDNGSWLNMHGALIGSLPQYLQEGKSIEPYARVQLRWQKYSIGSTSDTKLQLGANIGAVFKVIDLVDFTAEIQVDDEFAFLIGIDLLQF